MTEVHSSNEDSLSSGVNDFHNRSNSHSRSVENSLSQSLSKSTARERIRTSSSARSFWSIGRKESEEEVENRVFSQDIRDYELLNDIGGVDDISYLYLAKYIPTGQLVALKYTDLTLSRDYELIEEVIQTTLNTNHLRHPCLLRYFTSFVENERLWVVTLPMRAGNAKTILKNYAKTGFNEAVVACIMREVVKAVDYMHSHGLIHNDIRAENIFFDIDGSVRLSGVRQMVNLLSQGEIQRSVWTLLGENLEWLAPEVIAQNDNYTEKADIYSIGITALELAFNRTPFDDWAPLKMILSKTKYDIPAMEDTKTQKMSKNFYRFVQLCTARDASWRPSAVELLEHPFLKQAKGISTIRKAVIEKHKLHTKLEEAIQEHEATYNQETLSEKQNNGEPYKKIINESSESGIGSPSTAMEDVPEEEESKP